MEIVHGIKYTKPVVTLLQDTGIGVSEFSARTCYDSFENSENEVIKELDYQLSSGMGQDHYDESYKKDLNNIEHSDLLDDLAWTYFHHSILEHANLSFLIKGTSRGVLQEIARHRIASYSVRSTRYTMSNVINAFVSSLSSQTPMDNFIDIMRTLDLFVTIDNEYNDIQFDDIFNKLFYQYNKIGKEEFIKSAVAKSSLVYLEEYKPPEVLFDMLQKGAKKRNVGDKFKHIVNDNWKVDMVVTFNIRSLKNYFDLRDSGAAYFQIRWLAQEMIKATPLKYMKLISKKYKDK